MIIGHKAEYVDTNAARKVDVIGGVCTPPKQLFRLLWVFSVR